MKLHNLTPHPVTIITDAGSVHLPSEPGCTLQVEETQEVTEPVFVEGLPVPTVRVIGGSAVDLPEPAPDTLFVVSRVIAEARPDRTDLLVPYDLVRDAAGRVIACRSLARMAIAVDPRS
ncbi:MAG: hypothetical protein ACT4NY_12295 [Pseudonocardiales bacterium]